jgi:peptide/nickel transport system substrate-binding protein
MGFSRRNVLQLGVATAALAGFGGARAQDASRNADVIRMGIAAKGPRYSDPNLTTQGSDNWATEQIYEQLVRPEDGTFAIKPEEYLPTLATSWTSSPDTKTWTFQLRQGVQFHKGFGEMTSEDVVYSFKRAMTSGTNTTVLANIADVVANGPSQVTITLKSPDALFLGTSVFNNNTSIVSRKAAEQMGEAFGTDAVGTGPYELTKFDTQVGTVMKRHDGYWGPKAKISTVECVYIADTSARTLALLSGDIDIMEAVRAPGWVASMQQRDPTLKIDMTVPGSFNTLHINLTRKPFDDLRVRQALMHAIDRPGVAQALAPMGGTMAGLQPEFFPAGFPVQPARGLFLDHADRAGADPPGRLQHGPADRGPHRLSRRQPLGQEHAGDAFLELSADPDPAVFPAAVEAIRGQVGRQGRRQLQPLRRGHAGHRRPAGPGAGGDRFRDL